MQQENKGNVDSTKYETITLDDAELLVDINELLRIEKQ